MFKKKYFFTTIIFIATITTSLIHTFITPQKLLVLQAKLINAIVQGDIENVRTIINNGAKIDMIYVDPQSFVALHPLVIAMVENKKDIFTLLLTTYSAYTYYQPNGKMTMDPVILIAAASYNDLFYVKQILSNPRLQFDNLSQVINEAIQFAAMNQNTNMVQFLSSQLPRHSL